jgi:hypothetical protein
MVTIVILSQFKYVKSIMQLQNREDHIYIYIYIFMYGYTCVFGFVLYNSFIIVTNCMLVNGD